MNSNIIHQIKAKIISDPEYIDLINSNFTLKEFKNSILMDPNKVQTYFSNFMYEPDSLGYNGARNAISEHYNGSITSDQIVITASSSESYTAIFKSINEIKTVAFPNPIYPLFEYIGRYSNIKSVKYSLDVKDWSVDIKNLETLKFDCLILITPNNPTGSSIEKKQLEEILEYAFLNNVYVIIDNVFEGFGNDNTIIEIIKKSNAKIFLLNGISKICGMPDLKIAWIACFNIEEKNFDELETYNDTYLNASYFSQYILNDILNTRADYQLKINKIISANQEVLKNCGIYSSGNSGIHRIVRIENGVGNEQVVIDLLEKHKVNIHPGYFYDIDDPELFVISLLQDEKKFLEGINRIKKYLSS